MSPKRLARDRAAAERFPVLGTATTMGQAVDAAIRHHEDRYPESLVYRVEVGSASDGARFEVEVRAAHFSVPIIYTVELG